MSGPFFFLPMWQQALSGAAAGMLGSIQAIAFGILAVMLVLSIYEAFARGGSPRDLVVSLVKYAVCAFLIQNWQSFFTDISNGFLVLASSIAGGRDFCATFKASIASLTTSGGSQASVWSSIFEGSLGAVSTYVMLAVIPLIYYVVMIIFEVIYTCWGLILFALGPLMVALLPSSAVAPVGKHFLRSTAEWCAWPLLYAIIAKLAFVINLPSVAAPASAIDIIPNSTTQTGTVLIAIVYILFLILIPFIAHLLIRGDFALTAVATIAMAMRTINIGSSVAGAAAGAGGGGAGAGAASAQQAGGGANGDAGPLHARSSGPPPPTPPVSAPVGTS
jgi:hypothetical protein